MNSYPANAATPDGGSVFLQACTYPVPPQGRMIARLQMLGGELVPRPPGCARRKAEVGNMVVHLGAPMPNNSSPQAISSYLLSLFLWIVTQLTSANTQWHRFVWPAVPDPCQCPTLKTFF